MRWGRNWGLIKQMERRYATSREILRAVQAANRKRKRKLREKAKAKTNLPQRPLVYANYLKTKWWKARRKSKLHRTRGKCERCGSPATQVHHKHYKSLWNEQDKDLESLCRDCHAAEHEGLIQSNKHMASI